jgi:hypothetical protein
LDNNNAGARAISQSISITSSTVFTTVGSLNVYPFTTSLRMTPVWSNNWWNYGYDESKMLDYSLVAGISSSNLVINLTAQT